MRVGPGKVAQCAHPISLFDYQMPPVAPATASLRPSCTSVVKATVEHVILAMPHLYNVPRSAPVVQSERSSDAAQKYMYTSCHTGIA